MCYCTFTLTGLETPGRARSLHTLQLSYSPSLKTCCLFSNAQPALDSLRFANTKATHPISNTTLRIPQICYNLYSQWQEARKTARATVGILKYPYEHKKEEKKGNCRNFTAPRIPRVRYGHPKSSAEVTNMTLFLPKVYHTVTQHKSLTHCFCWKSISHLTYSISISTDTAKSAILVWWQLYLYAA